MFSLSNIVSLPIKIIHYLNRLVSTFYGQRCKYSPLQTYFESVNSTGPCFSSKSLIVLLIKNIICPLAERSLYFEI